MEHYGPFETKEQSVIKIMTTSTNFKMKKVKNWQRNFGTRFVFLLAFIVNNFYFLLFCLF